MVDFLIVITLGNCGLKLRKIFLLNWDPRLMSSFVIKPRIFLEV